MFPTKSKTRPLGPIDWPNFRPQPISCPVSGSLKRTQVRSSGPRQRSGRLSEPKVRSSELNQRSGCSSGPLSARAPSSRGSVARANASENQSGFLQLSLFLFPLLHLFPQQPAINFGPPVHSTFTPFTY